MTDYLTTSQLDAIEQDLQISAPGLALQAIRSLRSWYATAIKERDKARDERDQAQAACAAMRDRLSRIEREVFGAGGADFGHIRMDVRAALATDAGKGWVGPEVVAQVREALNSAAVFLHGDECGGNPEGFTHSEICDHECPQCLDDGCPDHPHEACFLTHCDCSIGPALRALALLPGEKKEWWCARCNSACFELHGQCRGCGSPATTRVPDEKGGA